MKTLLLVLIMLCISVCPLRAQSFELMGVAELMSNDCVQLTPDIAYARGLAYYKVPLDLSRYFEISFDLYLGNKDEGADGITFVMHNDPRGLGAYGTWGECMGYGRWSKFYEAGDYIAPSIAIEFDTYQNLRQNDPVHDHIAYLENGTNYHEVYWHDNKGNYNLEDDHMHDFTFQWNPSTQQINVYFDGRIVYQGKRNLIAEVFGGKTQVIWGFTASTGRQHNLQYFCLKRVAKAQTE